MTIPFFVLFIAGLGMLVRGLMTVSKARAAWMARSVAATANVIACTAHPRTDTDQIDAFTISVRYADAHGQIQIADLPAAQRFQAGDPIDIRFDPSHPATVYLSEHFAGTKLPLALIAFGGALMMVSFAYIKGD
jgi:hypothetical protein